MYILYVYTVVCIFYLTCRISRATGFRGLTLSNKVSVDGGQAKRDSHIEWFSLGKPCILTVSMWSSNLAVGGPEASIHAHY
jgi:hypothetical protein